MATGKIGLNPAHIDFANAIVVDTSGENLNSYTRGGVWWFTTAANPTNRPSGAAKYGYLFVLNTGNNLSRLHQIWIDITKDGDNLYFRSNNSSPASWGAWKRIATEQDVNAVGAELKWTPKLYDSSTYLMDLPEARYWKVGGLYVAEFHDNYTGRTPPTISSSGMLQIRNLPFSTVIGGSIMSGLSGAYSDRDIQGNVSYFYPRPNITGTLVAGQLSGMIIGY